MDAERLELPEPEDDGFTGRNATNYVLYIHWRLSRSFTFLAIGKACKAPDASPKGGFFYSGPKGD